MKRVAILLIIAILCTTTIPVFAEDTDLPSGWAVDDIEALAYEAFIKDDLFSLYQTNITRGDYAYLVYKLFEAYDVDINQFIDYEKVYDLRDTNDFMIQSLYLAGVINGYPDNTFRPDQTITRQEICTLYVKALELLGVTLTENPQKFNTYADAGQVANWSRESLSKCLNHGIINGVSGNNISSVGLATKEQSLVILNRIISNDSFMVKPSYQGVFYDTKAITYEKDIAYVVKHNLLSEPVAIDAFDGVTLSKHFDVQPTTSDIDAYGRGLYYINSESLMVYDLKDNTKETVIEGISDYVVVNNEIYFVSAKSMGRISTKRHNSAETLYLGENPLNIIKGYFDGNELTIYMLDDKNQLFQWSEDESVLLSSDVEEFYRSGDTLYLITSNNELQISDLLVNEVEVLDTGVSSMTMVGPNLLYIKNNDQLYNRSRGQTSLLYKGSDLTIESENIYVRLSEATMASLEYHHLMTIFDMESYLSLN